MKRVNINLPEELFEQLRERAFKDRVSITEIVRRALKEYLHYDS